MAVKIDAGHVHKYLRHLGFGVALAPGQATSLLLVGACVTDARGAPDTYQSFAAGTKAEIEVIPNRPDHQDDLWLTVEEGPRGAGDILHCNRGTAEPGAYYKHSQGRANLVWCHPHQFVRGKHYGNKKDVLRPKDGENRYWRDADYDFNRDPEEGVATGNGTLLIHAMSKEPIQKDGAGCGGIFDPKGYKGEVWRGWRDRAFRTSKEVGSYQVVIMPARDFVRWVASPLDHRPTLWEGATGLWVQRLQEALRRWSFASDLKVDGDFGRRTRQALLAFQAASNGVLVADAVAGPKTWSYLRRTTPR